jgi:hypothetical protein
VVDGAADGAVKLGANSSVSSGAMFARVARKVHTIKIPISVLS